MNGGVWQRTRITRALAAVAARGDAGWAAGEAGVLLKTADGGRHWRLVSSGSIVPLRDVVLTGAGGWAVGGDPIGGPAVLHSEDGVQWRRQDAGEGGTLNAVDSRDDLNGWYAIAVGDGGATLLTDDMGFTWMEGSLSTTEAWAVGGYFSASSVAIHTLDGGVTWTVVPTGSKAGLAGVDFVDPQTGWAVGWRGTILRTADGGHTWVKQAPPDGVAGKLNAVDAVGPLTAWAVGADGAILHTADGGMTWEAQASGTLVTLHSVRFATGTLGWASGENGTILETTDGGLVWTSIQSGTAVTLYGLWTDAAGRTLVAGDQGALLERATTE
jgi:photosystem II stability/assembly factor-like uncharacterized protein